MKMHLRALLLVGFVMSVTRADVSHLTTSNYASNSLHTTSDEQQPDFVSINFNNKIAAAGNNNKYKYWWMNTETSPFSDIPNANIERQRQTARGSDAQSQQHKNTLHDTHDTREQHRRTNQQLIRNPNNIYAHMTSLSGSPAEVNNLMFDAPSQSNYIARQYSPQTKIPCYGATQVCAPKDVCDNGLISEKNLGLVLSQANECDSRLETCCNIQPDQPEQQQQDDQSGEVCSDANSACVMARFCYNGFIDQSAEHNAVRSPKCTAPEVCCRFTDRRRQAPAYDDHDFAAANEGTSEVLTKEGYVVNVPSNQYLPSFPEPEYNPDASNDDVSKLKPSTQAPQPRPIPTTTQRPYQQPSTTQRPYQQPSSTTQRPYQQPSTTQRQYQQPSSTTQRQYQQPSTTQRQYQQPSTTQRPYRPVPTNPRPIVNVEDDAVRIVPSACPAAMNCTKEEYCTAIGWISKEPVVLNDFQKSFRVPMTDCMIAGTGELGKCCRDGDYTDPWPIGRSGQYVADELNAVFDSGAYKPDRRGQASASNQANSAASNQVITRVSAPQVQRAAPRPNREIPKRQHQNVQQSAPANSVQPTAAVAESTVTPHTTCGVRNYNTQPRGRAPLGTGFGEFTWVAMIILESKKALLCGGTIIDKNIVATSGNCVTGYRHNDVLIKAGEWRLGSDEEPKPFQIVRVKKIVFHPQFIRDTLEHDIALLHLENDIKYDSHIGPICLDDVATKAVSPNDNCVTTGWGKEVLKVHLGNALMQHTPVSVLSESDCRSQLTSANVNFFESVICGATQHDVCQVDPGSALACADASGRYVFKGVLSADTGCNSLAVYNSADLSWIKSFMSSARPHYN